MVRLIAFCLAGCCYFQPVFAVGADAARHLVGSWRLTSWVVQIVGEEAKEPFGPNPKGRIIITPDQYMVAIMSAPDRKPATSNDERAALLNSMLAYTGKFTIDGDRFTTKVDLSWNELLTGQDQERFFSVEEDKLTIRTAEQVSAVYPGKKIVGILTWVREH